MQYTSNERKKVYRLWSNIKNRCYNNNPENIGSYKSYGGKGVTMCDRWLNSFDNFLEDLPKIDGFDRDKYFQNLLQLDKDYKQKNIKNKVYSLETCQFITQKENLELQDNKKHFWVVTPSGDIIESKGIKTFCKKHNIQHSHAMAMVRGDKTRKHIQGYQFFDHEPQKNEILRRRTYTAISPNGKEFDFYRYNDLEDIGHSRYKVREAINKGYLTKDGWAFKLKYDGYRL